MQLIQEFNELVEKEKALVAEQEKKGKELTEREALCANKEQDLKLRKLNLDSREALLVPIENMAQWKKDVQALEAKVQAEREALEADKKAFATTTQATKSQIENDRATSAKEADNNQRALANIEAIVSKRVKEVLCQYGQTDLAQKI